MAVSGGPAGTGPLSGRHDSVRASVDLRWPDRVVITAELDPPCSSGDTYARPLTEAGVAVRHRRYDELFHGFPTIPALTVTGPHERRSGRWCAPHFRPPVRAIIDRRLVTSGDSHYITARICCATTHLIFR
ncbi:alpha/beta hydrolase fold domain-containing protein [Nocardia grenadensis]|uniref:alpha/beta hydrolase fold domain-containing protein n=1 Tax=Nocardia grenadensis TaxID=931537 RepID=UPI003D71E36B